MYHIAKRGKGLNMPVLRRWMLVLASIGLISWAGCAEIDPEAEGVLRSMSQTLGAAKTLEVRADLDIDVPLEDGTLVEVHRTTKVLMARPGHLAVETEGDDINRSVRFRNGELVILDDDTYTRLQTPPTVEAMFDHMMMTYELSLPLADLLFKDSYTAMTAKVLTGRYLGQVTLNGRRCHHLVFHQQDLDWQLWVEVGQLPLPRRFTITYVQEPDQPQYTAHFGDWDLAPAVTDEDFAFDLPETAEEVSMDVLLGGE